MTEVDYYVLSDVAVQATYRHLIRSFLVEEPIGASVGLNEGDICKGWNNCCRLAAIDGMSFVAVDRSTNDVIGCCINKILTAGSIPFEVNTYGESARIRHLKLFEHRLAGDVMYLFPNSKRCLKLLFLSVDHAYRRLKVAETLATFSLNRAYYFGYDMACTAATSFKSQLLFQKLGLYTVKQIPYKEVIIDNQAIFKNMPFCHNTANLMVKHLVLL